MFRFTIRDVLWLTVVVAVVVLLWLQALLFDRERAAMQKEQAALTEKIAIIDAYSLKLERELEGLKPNP